MAKLQLAAVLFLLLAAQQPQQLNAKKQKPLVIAHRGACGVQPELTIAAFEEAIKQGADSVEVDTGVTADGKVVMLHEPELSVSTDVASKSQFADRRRFDMIWADYGTKNVSDWLLWNFTLAEVQSSLYKHQVMPYRDQSYNGKLRVPTLAETLQLTSSKGRMLLIEVKLCSYYKNRTGYDPVELVAADIEAAGLSNEPDLVQLQAFETSCCAALKRRLPKLPVYQLAQVASLSDSQLQQLRGLGLDGIGVHKAMVAAGGGDPSAKNFSQKYKVTGASDLVQRAHRLGNFRVFVWTLRNEDRHIAWSFHQDPAAEAKFFMDAGVDGLITDFPDTCRRVIECNAASAAAAAVATVVGAAAAAVQLLAASAGGI